MGAVTSAAQAFRHAYGNARRHYENFPVISWALPASMRDPVLVLYGYCRAVDDIGDEAPGDRLALLDQMEKEVTACFEGTPSPALRPLHQIIQSYRLPCQPFLDLIEANRMDQRCNRYASFVQLESYCRHSANPVGRLFLALFGYRDERRIALSDAICTGLQLTNFWQDISRDLQQDRVYLPQEDLDRFGYTEDELRSGTMNAAFRRLMAFQVERTRRFFRTGRPLLSALDNGLRHHVRLFITGGEYILNRIEGMNYEVLARRPTVSKWRQGWMILQAAWAARTGRNY